MKRIEAIDDSESSAGDRLMAYALGLMFSVLCWALLIRGILWAVEKL